ncbi:hypothetical protein P4S72_04320 [Vibrio sp. PP-XX7]
MVSRPMVPAPQSLWLAPKGTKKALVDFSTCYPERFYSPFNMMRKGLIKTLNIRPGFFSGVLWVYLAWMGEISPDVRGSTPPSSHPDANHRPEWLKFRMNFKVR